MQPTNNTPKTKKSIYKNPLFIIFIGLPIGITSLLFFAVIMAVILGYEGEKDQQTIQEPTQTTQPSIDQKIPYEVVETWDLPEGKGNVIVIDPKYDDQVELQKLGKQLDEENKDNTFAYVSVFTNLSAASYRKIAFCTPGLDKDIAVYGKYFAALYTKGNGGASYTVFQDRLNCSGEAENIIIKY